MAGDRLPWTPRAANAGDNFEPLKTLSWQLHVYGDATPEIRTLCGTRRLPMYTFEWRRDMRRRGLRRNALYLVRPDGYLAFVDERQDAALLAAYLDARRIAAAS